MGFRNILFLCSSRTNGNNINVYHIYRYSSESNRKYREVFKSKILRQGYVYKALGYYIAAGAIFPLDYYALTPFANGILSFLNFSFMITTPAIFTNILLGIFAIIELASINENWFDITGNNVLKKSCETVRKLKKGLKDFSDFHKEIKPLFIEKLLTLGCEIFLKII